MAYIRTELVTALERGMVVLQSFSQQALPMTLSEVARANGLTVATARRAVLTLEKLGYLGRNERRFVLRPRVLSLSAGYLTAVRRPFQPFVEGIVRERQGSASVAVLDGGHVICVAYASTSPPGDVRRGAGARWPVHATAAGRVLQTTRRADHAVGRDRSRHRQDSWTYSKDAARAMAVVPPKQGVVGKNLASRGGSGG